MGKAVSNRQGTSRATRKKICPQPSEKRASVRISIIEGKKKKSPSPTPNNLSEYRWRHPLPDAERDAELVRLAKAGDPKAAREIVTNYHRYIVGRASKNRVTYRVRKKHKATGTVKEHTNGAFDDLIGRGFEALWRAVLTYDESKGPFHAYARRCISGQISKEASDFVKRGSVGETRIERWLFAHSNATPGELVAAFKKRGTDIDLWEAKSEIAQFKARCSWRRYKAPSDGKDDPWDWEEWED
jgi:hypothetical protein